MHPLPTAQSWASRQLCNEKMVLTVTSIRPNRRAPHMNVSRLTGFAYQCAMKWRSIRSVALGMVASANLVEVTALVRNNVGCSALMGQLTTCSSRLTPRAPAAYFNHSGMLSGDPGGGQVERCRPVHRCTRRQSVSTQKGTRHS